MMIVYNLFIMIKRLNFKMWKKCLLKKIWIKYFIVLIIIIYKIIFIEVGKRIDK